jgi:hypothetical protein
MKSYMGSVLLALIMIGCGGGDSTLSQIGTGYYVDSPVKGVNYVCGNQKGMTDIDGKFTFQKGKECHFYVGENFFRSVDSAVLEDGVVIQETNTDIARLLLTLDNDQNPDNGIEITKEVAEKVTKIPQSEVDFSVLVATLMKSVDTYQGKIFSEDEAKEHLKKATKIVVAKATISSESIVQGESITLSAAQSSSTKGGTLSYDWTENGVRLSTKESFSKSDFTIGSHTVTLRVRDAKGNEATDSVTFEVKSPKAPTKWDNVSPLANNGEDKLYVTSDEANLYIKVVAENNVTDAMILINSDDSNMTGFASSIWGEGFDYIVKSDAIYKLDTSSEYREEELHAMQYSVNGKEIEVAIDKKDFDYLAENIAVTVFFPNNIEKNIPVEKPANRFKDSFYDNEQEDTVAPVIVLNDASHASHMKIDVGETYMEPGAAAMDVRDGNVTASLEEDSSDLNTSKVGFYSILYRAKDSKNNEATAARIVEVVGATNEKTLEVKTLGAKGDVVAINHQTGLVWANDDRDEATTRGCIIFGSGASAADIEQSFKDFCEKSDYAGLTDWRVPTSLELSKFMVQMQQEDKTPGMARKGCVRIIAIDNNTSVKAVWTRNLAKAVVGYIESETISPSGGRCVRGKEDRSKGGFSFDEAKQSEAKVIIDSHNRMWVNEFVASNKACLAIHKDKPDEYNSSKDFCAKLDYAGHDDWRDPTAQEVSTFVKESNEAHIFIGFEAPCKRLLARSIDGNESVVSTRFDKNKTLGTISPLEANLSSNIGLRCVRDN